MGSLISTCLKMQHEFRGRGVPDLQRVNAVLQSSLKTYGSHNLMGYISGNHDKPRFMALASGDLKFGKTANSPVGNEKSDYRQHGIRQNGANADLYLNYPGVPVIFTAMKLA